LQNPQEKIRNSGMLPIFGIELTNFIGRSQRGHASIGLSFVQQSATEYGLSPVITITQEWWLRCRLIDGLGMGPK
jgi:hypothetical protein